MTDTLRPCDHPESKRYVCVCEYDRLKAEIEAKSNHADTQEEIMLGLFKKLETKEAEVAELKDCIKRTNDFRIDEINTSNKFYMELQAHREREKKLVDAAEKVVIHYEFVHRGVPVSTGVYLIGKLKEALAAHKETNKP